MKILKVALLGGLLALSALPVARANPPFAKEAQATWAQLWKCRGGHERRYACMKEIFSARVPSDDYLKYDFLLTDSFSEVEFADCPSSVKKIERLIYKTIPSPLSSCFAYSRYGEKRWAQVYFEKEKDQLKIFSIFMR